MSDIVSKFIVSRHVLQISLIYLVHSHSDDGVDMEEIYPLTRVDSVTGTVGDGVSSLSLKFR